ncbi:MAG TPA: type I polyketide synthase [Terriglobia bacterium]|nr:type I polyketide synthase [Terriglobia bacterium]
MSAAPISEHTLSPTKRAIHALRAARSKLEALEQGQKEPIAIIGMGCRLPGDIEGPRAFWELLRAGRDAIGEVPASRWDVDHYYDPDFKTPGKMVTRHGGFLHRVQDFDPLFFGISPREAVSMDPQQHLLLEVCWEALENACLVPADLKGSRTGVFIGICNQDYSVLLTSRDETEIDAYMSTGIAHSVAAGRLAYSLGFHGPCLAVDTACSSSLVAVHLACQSLRNRECDLAVAGGVNLILCPETSINFSKSRMLAPDGRCKTFAAAADGFGRGEGCGLIVLQRLSDGMPHQDQVLACIRGSAINQDGATSGLTVPNGPAQQAVIREALKNAGVSPHQIHYVEAHGTGTSLGDPIEIGALNAVFGAARHPDDPLVVGSVKTNLGHLEAAAGIGGLMKVVLALRHQEIPPHLHFNTPNPHIPWEEMPILVASRTLAWPSGGKARLAGVSSFGFSGTNAHVVLEEAPPTDDRGFGYECARTATAPDLERPVHILTLSARSPEALQAQAKACAACLAEPDRVSLADVCYTANTTRSVFEQRLIVAAADKTEMRTKLERFRSGCQERWVAHGRVRDADPPLLAFLFTGQGSQYPGMGASLYQTQPVFRQEVDDCASILDPLLGQSLTTLLFDEATSDLHQTAFTQPALFALEYALARMWLSWGVQPGAVMGHSVGEYVAACIAGVFSVEDGLRLIAERGRLMQALPRNGAMVVAFAGQKQIVPIINKLRADVSIAAVNSSTETVVSGEQTAVQLLVARLTAAGIRSQELIVSHAFHSVLMEPMLAEFDRVIRGVSLSPPRIRLVSNMTGDFVKREVTDPAYWCRHIRMPVLFAAGLARLRQHGIRAFVEMGPHPVLVGMARAQASDDPARSREFYLPSLRKGQPDWAMLANSLSELYLGGVPINWVGFDSPYNRRRTDLPTYPFQRKRYWFSDSAVVRRQSSPAASPLIRLLKQGDAEALARYLEAGCELTAEEAKFLPKFSDLLIRQHRQAPSEAQNGLCYRLVWLEKASANERRRDAWSTRDQAGAWVLLTDNEAFELAQPMRDVGQRVIRVVPGRAYERAAANLWTIDPTNEGEYWRLLEEIAAETALEGVVYLWPSDPDLERPSQELGERNLIQVVRLARTLARCKTPPRLWLMTRAATSAGGSGLSSPFPSLLWGMGRSLFLEHPALKGGLIDVSPEPSAEETQAVLQELLDPDGEDGIALRGGKRYVARLQSSSPITSELPRLKSDGSYLITGGLGALGLHVARLLAEHDAGQLVLVGRRGAGGQARKTLDFLQQQGTRVLVTQADITDEAAVRGILDQIEASRFTLSGVIHAAGVLIPRSISEVDPGCLHDVLAPKVDGAWVLHRVTQHRALDFFVSFSSVSSVLGTAFQAHYTAANAFLDGLAEYRRGLHLPALSIGWGPWQGGGLVDDIIGQRIADSGFKALPPQTALALLRRLLGADQSREIVVNADWTRVKSLYEIRGRQPVLEFLGTVVHGEGSVESSAVLDELRATAVRNRFDFLVSYLQEQVSAVLHFEDKSLPDSRQGFFDMGLDSLTALEFKGRVETQLGCPLPSSVAFDYPNIEALAGYLLELFFPGGPGPDRTGPAAKLANAATAEEAQTEIDVHHLSDTQIATFIDDELAALVGKG